MDRAYAALSDRVIVGGERWADRLIGHDVKCVTAHPDAPERAYVGTGDDGLQRTSDGGTAWTTALATDDRVTAVAVDPSDPEVVWAGTEPSAVYRSTDGGRSWSEREGLTELDSASRWSFPPRPQTHQVHWLAVAPDDPDRLYVAIEAGAFVYTTDAGSTWRDHPAGARRDNHTLATHPETPDRVYSAAGDGYAVSTDRGEHWTTPQDGLDHRYVWSVAVHPDDPDTVVVSAATGPRRAHSTTGESYVYRTTGDGWERAMAGLPGPDGLARPVLSAGDDALWALTNHGLYRSADGREWTPLGQWRTDYNQLPHGLAVV